jgi:hypothetical protein
MRGWFGAVLMVAGCGTPLASEEGVDLDSVAEASERSGLTFLSALLLADAHLQGNETVAPRLGAVACPSVEAHEEGGATVMTVDYGAGCVPDSEIITVPIAGAGTLTWTDTSARFETDGLSSSGVTFTGAADAVWTDDETVTLSIDVVATGAIEAELDQDVEIGLGSEFTTLDGASGVVLGDDLVAVAIHEVAIARGAPTECPLPNSGSVVLVAGADGMSFVFDTDSPEDGTVDLTMGGHAYGDVDVCSWALRL